jgi:hypothetical protein
MGVNVINGFHHKLNGFISTRELFFLCALFVAALTIRAINMDWGLPGQLYRHSAYVADEIGILDATMLIGQGSYLTRILQNYPFFYYLSFFVMSGYYLVGRLTGTFGDLTDFHIYYIVDPGQFILVGRYFILISASLTVVVTYLVARRLFGQRVALFASLFMLFSLGHVMYSHIFRLDSFLPLLFLLTFWAIVAAKDAPAKKLRPYVVCAVLLAFTVGTKVTAWAMIIPFFLMPFLTETRLGIGWPKIDRRFVFAVYVMAALYLTQIAPALVDIPEIVAGVSTRLDKSGTFGNPADLTPYRYSIIWYLLRILPQQLGLPVYLLAVGGLGLMLGDRGKRPYIWLLFALLLAYLLPVGYATRTTWRDMLPMLPFLAIAAGYGLDWLLQRMMGWQPILVRRLTEPGLAAAVLLLVLIWPLTDTLQNKYLLSQADTREIATSWIEANIPAGTNIAVESYGPAILDARHEEAIRRRVAALNGQLSPSEQPVYHIFGLDWELAEGRLLLPDELVPFLLENEIEYVVVSSGYYARFFNEAVDFHVPPLGQAGREFHDLIASNLEPVQTFVPNWRDRPGPVIQIFRVPDDLAEDPVLIPDSFDPYLSLDPPASAVGYYQTSPH